MRFSDIINEAPKNDPEELKRRLARTKDVHDKRDAEKAERSKRASELGKKGAQARALNKDFKAFNKDLRKDELERREQEQNAQPQNVERDPPASPNNASLSDAEKDLIAPFIKNQIRDRKRKRGIEGDQGVEERDVLDFAKEKYPNADPSEIESLWKQVTGGTPEKPKAADVATKFGDTPADNAEKPEQSQPQQQQQPRSAPAKKPSSKGSVMGQIMSKVKDMSMKELKIFKKELES